jgi:hypothetical protein
MKKLDALSLYCEIEDATQKQCPEYKTYKKMRAFGGQLSVERVKEKGDGMGSIIVKRNCEALVTPESILYYLIQTIRPPPRPKD